MVWQKMSEAPYAHRRGKVSGYQSIVDSVIRTTGYKQRYERFARYLSDHQLDE